MKQLTQTCIKRTRDKTQSVFSPGIRLFISEFRHPNPCTKVLRPCFSCISGLRHPDPCTKVTTPCFSCISGLRHPNPYTKVTTPCFSCILRLRHPGKVITPYPYPPFFITFSFGMVSFTYKKNLKKKQNLKNIFKKKRKKKAKSKKKGEFQNSK